MWTITGFADEIADDLQGQCELLDTLGIRHLELRSAWGTNVSELTDEQLARAREVLDDHAITVSSIGSPIGKISLADDFEEHLARFDRCLEAARVLDAPYLRLFSFYPTPGETFGPDPGGSLDPAGGGGEQARGEVLRRLGSLVARAAGHGVILLHENEKGIYGDVPARCADLLATVDSPLLRAAWDAANFVQCGVDPYADGYALLRPWISYVHVKDARAADGTVTPAGQGDGDLRRTFRALADDGFDGFLSLEPHLAQAKRFGGFSGPQLFTVAHEALVGLLAELGIDHA